jgi:hypothetical protein
LDAKKPAIKNKKSQQDKLNSISSIITGYMYKNRDYVNYPHLSGAVHKIIELKRADADSDMADLLGGL